MLFSYSQESETGYDPAFFRGAVTVTNKGISTIPNLTLGKPAVVFDLVMGKGKLAFEPQLRWALNSKPWSFLFWGRYYFLESEKFRMNLGVHPAIAFREIEIDTRFGKTNVMRGQRYLAADLVPTFRISRSFSVGMYYLYSHGLDKDITRNTHFVSLRSIITNIKLSEQFSMRLVPQFYYLKMDINNGFYLNGTIGLSKQNLPFTLASNITQPLKTDIPAGSDFLWNVSLIYSFSKRYREISQ